MESVLRTYRDLEMPGFAVKVLATFVAGQPRHSLSDAARTLLWCARHARGISLIHVHLSHHGSFVREGAFLLLARAARIPRLATIHGSDFAGFTSKAPRLARYVLGAAQFVIVLNPETANRVRSLVHVPVAEIANPVAMPPSAAPVAGSGPHALFAGSIGERKGVDVLLLAWAEVLQSLPTAELRLAGPVEDGYAERLEGVRGVQWLGNLQHPQLLQQLCEARVAVLPSRREAMPVFVLEAMAAGVPVVVTNVGAMAQLARGNGSVTEVEDWSQLAQSLLTYLTDANLAAAHGRLARQKVLREFSTDVVAARLGEIYSRYAR